MYEFFTWTSRLCVLRFFFSIQLGLTSCSSSVHVRLCATWMFEWHKNLTTKAERQTYTHELRGTDIVRVWFLLKYAGCGCLYRTCANQIIYTIRLCETTISNTWWRRSSSVARCVEYYFKHTYVFPVVNVFVLALTITTPTQSSGRNFNSISSIILEWQYFFMQPNSHTNSITFMFSSKPFNVREERKKRSTQHYSSIQWNVATPHIWTRFHLINKWF